MSIFSKPGTGDGISPEQLASLVSDPELAAALADKATNVVSKNKLPEDVEFQLTAYETNPSTTPPGTAFAAKIVLPHLRWSKRKSEECTTIWERVCDRARTGRKLPNGYSCQMAEVAQFLEAE